MRGRASAVARTPGSCHPVREAAARRAQARRAVRALFANGRQQHKCRSAGHALQQAKAQGAACPRTLIDGSTLAKQVQRISVHRNIRNSYSQKPATKDTNHFGKAAREGGRPRYRRSRCRSPHPPCSLQPPCSASPAPALLPRAGEQHGAEESALRASNSAGLL